MRLTLRRADAYRLYLLISGWQSFAFTLAFTINLVYQARQVGLNPLQLVLIGACLELTALLTEAPTGVVADVFSRRLSVILGYILLGAGFIVEGALPYFAALLIAQVILGCGFTFISGAKSAWIADEIGLARAGDAFLRGAQAEQICGFAAIFCSVALASFSLQLAIICAGLMLLALALLLILLMPEAGFKRVSSSPRQNWQALFSTFRAGASLVRGRRLLLLIMIATIIHGAFSEGFDRLWTAHVLGSFHLPALGQLDDIVWFGIISAVAMPLGALAAEIARRRLDLGSSDALARALMTIYALMLVCALAFALSGSLVVALLGYWGARALRQLRDPLMDAWINQHTESPLRATVLSIQGQADAFGQIAGGPVIGAVGLLASVRTAIALSALMLTPILAVFRRTLGAPRPPTVPSGRDGHAPLE